MALETLLPWVNAGSSLLNALSGGGAPPSGPVISGGGPTMQSSDLDFSGFTVATGQAKADGAKINKTSSDSLSGPPASGSSSGLGSISPGMVLGLAAAAGLLWNKFNAE